MKFEYKCPKCGKVEIFKSQKTVDYKIANNEFCRNCKAKEKQASEYYSRLCPECANSVWVVMNIYENGFEELSAIYRTAEDAKTHVKALKVLTEKLNKTAENKLVRHEINKWIVA